MVASRPPLDDLHPLDPEYWSAALDGELSTEELARLLKYPDEDIQKIQNAWKHHLLLGEFVRHGTCRTCDLSARSMAKIFPKTHALTSLNTQIQPAPKTTKKRWYFALQGFRLATASLATIALATWIGAMFFMPTSPPSDQVAATLPNNPAEPTLAGISPLAKQPPLLFQFTNRQPSTVSEQFVQHTNVPKNPALLADEDSVDDLRLLHWSNDNLPHSMNLQLAGHANEGQ